MLRSRGRGSRERIPACQPAGLSTPRLSISSPTREEQTMRRSAGPERPRHALQAAREPLRPSEWALTASGASYGLPPTSDQRAGADRLRAVVDAPTMRSTADRPARRQATSITPAPRKVLHSSAAPPSEHGRKIRRAFLHPLDRDCGEHGVRGVDYCSGTSALRMPSKIGSSWAR